MAVSRAPDPNTVKRSWARFAPLVLAVVLIAWMLRKVDTGKVLTAMAGAPKLELGLEALAFLVLLLLADTWATQKIYARTVCPVTWPELIVLRGASYLPSILNQHVGQGWLTYFLSRVYGARLLRVAGATLVVYVTTFACLVAMGLAALPFNASKLPWLPGTLAFCVVGGIGYLLVLALKPKWLADRPLLGPLFDLGVGGHLTILAARMPHMLVLFFGMWLPFFLFGVNVPLGDALALIPPLLFVTGLPLTPQGIGTRDVMAVALFSSYASAGADGATQVLATTLSWTTATTLIQLVGSPPLMRRAYSLVAQARSKATLPPPATVDVSSVS
ncbi:MAG TPA: lysylphosphatidylglycerol synthase domain-containing protein [Polyangiaceae bacterium]|jgi:hypothetical protein|nr:lysylphosphatidylglycerol synthase domain-containing protein [Polyangiaceae bacterium]